MNTAMSPDRCPECGAPLAPGSAQGLCARCLMAGAAAATEHAAPRSAPPTLEQVAAAFPQFEIIELIGRGGMGAVYKVRQPKLDRFAALKLLPQSLGADPAFASRFEREARLLGRLNHPNIVAVYEFGSVAAAVSVSQLSTNDSQLPFYYLLMEHVDGVNLRQAMRASRFTPAQALGVVPKICEALQYAHDEGVLHRDIKPENILLDAKGRVKLADFGIAKLIAESDPTSSKSDAKDPTLTHAGAALGTPQYMAPEQRDTPADVDHRADIYSLGVVFYELLTGELPVGKFAPPSERSAADPRVDDIVRQAMEKERGRRQGSAEEMRTQVQTVAEGGARPPAATPPPIPRKSFLARLRRAVLAGGALLLLAGLVLFGLDGLLPPVYFSKVAMEVKPDNSGPINGILRGREPLRVDPQFVSTQFNILQKKEILNQVIDNLKLVEAWSPEGKLLPLQSVYAKLLDMLALRQLRDTGIIEVGVYSTDPQEATNIANTIAIVYQQKRLTDVQKNIDKGMEQLRDEVDKQRKRAEESATEAAAIRERDGIVDPDPDSRGSTLTFSKDPVNLRPYVEAKARALQAGRIYEAAQTKYSTELLERGIDFDPAKIWEKAEPAIAPTRFSLYRLPHVFSR